MTLAEILAVYRTEIAYPTDVINNGRQYVFGGRSPIGHLPLRVRRAQSQRRLSELAAVTSRQRPSCAILRIHRVGVR